MSRNTKATFAILSSLITTAISVQLNISSNTLISVNNYTQTSNYLLGLSAYGATPLSNNSYLKELNSNLSVNVIGFGEQLNGILPTNQAEGVKCCNTTQGLREYIQNGSACINYAKSYDPQKWNSDFYKQDTTITTFIYLKDSCQNDYYPEDYHCIGNDTGFT